MKSLKKIVTSSLLLGAFAFPVIVQAAPVNKLISAGNGTFYSIASSSSLSGNMKAVNGASSASSNMKFVESSAGSSYKKDTKRATSYYTSNREIGVTVTNSGTPTSGTRNSHSSVQ